MLAIVVIVAIAEPAFLTPGNLIGIVRQVAIIGIMAVCMTFVIMTGGVDLSVGPVLALGGLVSYFFLKPDPRCPSSSLPVSRAASWSDCSSARVSHSCNCRPSSSRWPCSASCAEPP
jgi:ribose/xylose/arabinose/galactoside ABC-type transport system permease subunit